MPNKLEVIDVLFVPGRQDFLAVVRAISGDVKQVRWPMRSPEISGEWSLTSMPLVEPDPDAEATDNIAIGLSGPRELAAGMHLVDSDA